MEPSTVEISPDKTVATVALSVRGGGTDGASTDKSRCSREHVVPATLGRLAGAQVAVTGRIEVVLLTALPDCIEGCV